MDNFRRRVFEKAGYTNFSITLDRCCSECLSPNGLTYYLKYKDLDCTQLVEGYKYKGEVLIEQQCEVDTTVFRQRWLSIRAMRNIPKFQLTFLDYDGIEVNTIFREELTTYPNGKRKPRRR